MAFEKFALKQVEYPSLSGTGSVTPDPTKGAQHHIKLTGSSALTLTINAPAPMGSVQIGSRLFLYLDYTAHSTGAITLSMNSIFKGTPTNPTPASRAINAFVWDGTNWVLQVAGTASA